MSKDKNETGCVYILESNNLTRKIRGSKRETQNNRQRGHGYSVFKVGKSEDPYARINELNSEKYGGTSDWTFPKDSNGQNAIYPFSRALKKEGNLHKWMADYCKNADWLDPQEFDFLVNKDGKRSTEIYFGSAKVAMISIHRAAFPIEGESKSLQECREKNEKLSAAYRDAVNALSDIKNSLKNKAENEQLLNDSISLIRKEKNEISSKLSAKEEEIERLGCELLRIKKKRTVAVTFASIMLVAALIFIANISMKLLYPLHEWRMQGSSISFTPARNKEELMVALEKSQEAVVNRAAEAISMSESEWNSAKNWINMQSNRRDRLQKIAEFYGDPGNSAPFPCLTIPGNSGWKRGGTSLWGCMIALPSSTGW
ncbi:hypothetical protein [Azospirillum argentinense]|uniref:hypothetical protein n=1 Tax=Azospirillum argentinense TaxID=2970906 RepID=UPI0011AFCD6A|nr:hypothetical protein [Azospirillum argentinense]